jgi:hypothetical protein
MRNKVFCRWKVVLIWHTTTLHTLLRCALRMHGYRSENRYTVFQSLEHTIGFRPQQWLLLDLAHKKRNLSEYEGDLDVTASFVGELVSMVDVLVARVGELSV